jgi:hypothetical protein
MANPIHLEDNNTTLDDEAGNPIEMEQTTSPYNGMFDPAIFDPVIFQTSMHEIRPWWSTSANPRVVSML